MGMYLAKLHEARLITLINEGSEDIDILANRTKRLALEHQAAYHRHVNKFGHSVHIPRHHGEDISLLVEIVDKNSREHLFKDIDMHRERVIKGASQDD